MSKLLVTDELWAIVEPLLPKHEPSPKGGKPRTPDRVCLTGILFVLKSGTAWEDFPHEMGCSGMTLWNRLAEWKHAGVWDALHQKLLAELRSEDAVDLEEVIVDSSSVRAMYRGKKRGRGRALPSARAPWTGRNTGPSTTSRPTPTARLWRRRSPGPTPRT